MAKLFRKKMLLAKIETTYGVDATPTGAANAILTKDLSINLMQGNTVERNVDRTTLGGDIAIHVAPYTTVSFSVELASSGAAGTAPAWGPLLQACGLSETLVASTTATYAPVSTGFKSVTLYFHIDGLLHKLLGCRGTFTVSMDPGSLPYLNFTFTGIRAAPTDTALPTPTLTAFKTPLAVNKANTPTFSLHGFAATVEKFTFDFANEITYRNVVGDESVMLVDRKPTGSVSLEEQALATKNFHSLTLDSTLGALQVVHGTTAGSIIQIDAPKVQLLSPTYADSNGVLMLNMNLSFTPNAGDDELIIVAK